MKQKLLLFVAALMMSTGIASAQVSRVFGEVVSSEDGQAVPGATVEVKGTKLSTFTASDGAFVINNIPATARTLVVSSIGMRSQEVRISGESMKIELTPLVRDEGAAVVIGYGTAKKIGTVVGSVSKVTTAQVEITPATNGMDALQGKAANVQILNSSGDPGQISQISTTIRGVGSLGADNEPLFVIDGSPVGSSVFYMLNPSDIESYTILRDASATSIYGSRAANGVIYVTTKRGSRNEKAQVKVSHMFGWTSIARRVGNPMNSAQLLDYQLKNGVIDGATYNYWKNLGYNTKWQDYLFEDNAPMMQTSVSISGGSERTTYYTSASYLDKDGLTPLSGFRRYTFRSNLDSRPFDWFHYGVNIGLSYDERQADRYNHRYYNGSSNRVLSSGGFGSLLLVPYYTPYDENGNHLQTIPGSGGWPNYYWDLRYQQRKSNDARIQGTAFIELTPLKGLTLRSQLGLDGVDTRYDSQNLPSSPFNDGPGQGWGMKSFSRSSMWTITNTAEYKMNIGKQHQVTLLAGQEGIKGTAEAFGASMDGMSDDRLMELQEGTDADLANITSSHSKYEFVSFFGRVDYSFGNRYFANFNVRTDRCSRFGKDNRSATFLSGGLMWNMKAERFMWGIKWLNDLKLKASVGSTGNSGIDNYDALGTTTSEGIRYNNSNGLVLYQPGNAMLGWEKQIQWDFGFNARMFDRLNVEFSYYIRNTKDMLMDAPVPHTTGFSEQALNIGGMRNSGFEFTFNVDAVRVKNGPQVNVYGNIAYNRQEITKLMYGWDEFPLPNYGYNYQVGKRINFWLPIRAGIDPADGEIMWFVPDANGKPTKETTKEWNEDVLYANSGKPLMAPWTGGFGVRASWLGFTLNADFAFVLNKWMMNAVDYFTHNHNFGSGGYNQDKSMAYAWTKPGDITSVPRFGVSNQFDSSLLQNASFCRMKNLSLSYDLPKAWMDATGFMSNLRLTVAARNLWTITKYKGADPEYDSNMAYGLYPNTREFTVGVEVTF